MWEGFLFFFLFPLSFCETLDELNDNTHSINNFKKKEKRKNITRKEES